MGVDRQDGSTDQLRRLEEEIKGCELCRLHEERTHAVPGTGSHDADVMFIGEAPGRQEDEEGKPFVGRAGEVLNELLESVDLSRKEVYITNVVKCRPPDNRDPRKNEKETCWPYLEEQIRSLEPEIIVTLGNHATEALTGESGMKEVHGERLEYKSIPLVPMYHPAAALYNPNLKSVMEEDMEVLK